MLLCAIIASRPTQRAILAQFLYQRAFLVGMLPALLLQNHFGDEEYQNNDGTKLALLISLLVRMVNHKEGQGKQIQQARRKLEQARGTRFRADLARNFTTAIHTAWRASGLKNNVPKENGPQ